MPAIIEENWPQLCQAQPVLCPHYCKNQRKTPLMLATCALPIPETKTPYKYRPTLDLAFDSGRASGDPCRSPEIDRPVAYDIERRSLNPFCLSEPAGRVPGKFSDHQRLGMRLLENGPKTSPQLVVQLLSHGNVHGSS